MVSNPYATKKTTTTAGSRGTTSSAAIRKYLDQLKAEQVAKAKENFNTPVGGGPASQAAGPPAPITSTTGGAGGPGLGNVPIVGNASPVAAAGVNPYGTDPLKGFASRYLPTYADTLFQNPAIIARDTLSAMGLGNNVQLNQQLANNADLANVYTTLGLGMNHSASNPASTSELINAMNAFYQNQVTPGGRTIDPTEALRILSSAGMGYDQGKGGDNSALSAYLGVADPQTSASNYLGLAKDALAGGTNPFFQRAALAALADLADRYMSQSVQGGNAGNFGSFAGHNGF